MHVRATSLSDNEGKPRYLKQGESYTNSATVTLPTSMSGKFHILVKADTNFTLELDTPTAPSTVGDCLLTVNDLFDEGAMVGEFWDEGKKAYD